MNKDKLLDEILQYLRVMQEDEAKLQQILQFIKDEVYEEPEAEPIPEKYRKVVAKIAESIDAGEVCYLNPDTLELEEIYKEFLVDPEEYESMTGESYESLGLKHDEWDNCFTFEPLDSHDSFRIMEGFTEKMEDQKFQNQLINALNRRKPFANFKFLIDNSDYRQDWFDFKNQWLREYVWEQLERELRYLQDEDEEEFEG